MKFAELRQSSASQGEAASIQSQTTWNSWTSCSQHTSKDCAVPLERGGVFIPHCPVEERLLLSCSGQCHGLGWCQFFTIKPASTGHKAWGDASSPPTPQTCRSVSVQSQGEKKGLHVVPHQCQNKGHTQDASGLAFRVAACRAGVTTRCYHV